MLVYQITCVASGKRYIGWHSGNDLAKYWRENVRLAEKGRNDKPCLYAALRKYGADNFTARVLLIVATKEEALYYEQVLIARLKTKRPDGYNLTDGGEGTCGFHYSAEQSAHRSASRRGKSLSAASRLNISRACMGRPSPRKGVTLSSETRAKLQAALIGKPLSQGHRNSISAGLVGRPCSIDTRRKMSESRRAWWTKRKLMSSN